MISWTENKGNNESVYIIIFCIACRYNVPFDNLV